MLVLTMDLKEHSEHISSLTKIFLANTTLFNLYNLRRAVRDMELMCDELIIEHSEGG